MSRILVTGSRDITYETIRKIEDFLLSLESGVIIIHGGARGVDSEVEEKCKDIGIKTEIYRPINPSISSYYLHRNAEMIGICDEVVAFWNGKSRGTKFTIDYANARGLNIRVIRYD